MESGHYTCFIRHQHNQWFQCDDQIISRAPIEKFLNFNLNLALQLVEIKQDLFSAVPVAIIIVIVSINLVWTSAVEPSLGLLRKSPGKLAKPSGYGERPRGVAFNNAPLYATGANFTCFSGTKMIPSTWVNDDYCD
ncbi:unnamed protein product, partial [Anisakis simplex]|uniref:USP domain-containing protein n=1 Tax=Anisakis simplex TaxID=6269 RepID=A0A0M3KJ85_ANISI